MGVKNGAGACCTVAVPLGRSALPCRLRARENVEQAANGDPLTPIPQLFSFTCSLTFPSLPFSRSGGAEGLFVVCAWRGLSMPMFPER